jgi:hypothetical protein
MMKNIKQMNRSIMRTILVIFLGLNIIACSDDEKAVGRTNISLTDAPIDDENVSAVYISVLGVEVKNADSWITLETFGEPEVIDLLSYQNGESYFLTEKEIDAGEYSEVRLMLDIQTKMNGVQQNSGCFIEYKDGSTKPLFVPSGGQSGYKAKGDFTVPSGGVVNITLDFDLRKAIVKAGNSDKYILKPTVRLIANQDAALITGVFNTEATLFAKVVVYAYENDTFTADETNEPEAEEVRFSNAITSSGINETGEFTLAFMSSNTYDLYFASYDIDGNYLELLGSLNDVELTAGTNLTLEVNLIDLE